MTSTTSTSPPLLKLNDRRALSLPQRRGRRPDEDDANCACAPTRRRHFLVLLPAQRRGFPSRWHERGGTPPRAPSDPASGGKRCVFCSQIQWGRGETTSGTARNSTQRHPGVVPPAEDIFGSADCLCISNNSYFYRHSLLHVLQACEQTFFLLYILTGERCGCERADQRMV
jgi:hypothetical protein